MVFAGIACAAFAGTAFVAFAGIASVDIESSGLVTAAIVATDAIAATGASAVTDVIAGIIIARGYMYVTVMCHADTAIADTTADIIAADDIDLFTYAAIGTTIDLIENNKSPAQIGAGFLFIDVFKLMESNSSCIRYVETCKSSPGINRTNMIAVLAG